VPDPDLAAQVLADARFLGGGTFAALVAEDATAVADEVAPATGDGSHHSAWSAAAWQLVDGRRAELVGRLLPVPGGGARVVSPARCPHGHPLGPGRTLAGWRPCRCGGHRTWECVVAAADGAECRGVVLAPESGPRCRRLGIG
jgi:hypothetical protein